MKMRTLITTAALVLGVALLGGCGITSAGSLDVGDCFEDPGAGGFSSVTDQDCAEPHDIQIFGKTTGITSQCGTQLETLLFAEGVLDNPAIVIPDDTVVGEIGEEGETFGESLCFIESPSGGLVGSIVPENS